MDIENLNRTQIILLTLLVSFVTSIATGIVTVSLLQQAPPGITQTINRVVERTVEKVVPATTGGAVAGITKETTVVVKEDDLITGSIEKNGKSVVSIFEKTPGPDGLLRSSFVGWGIVLTDKGIIATDSGIIADSGIYAVTASDGKSFETKTLSQDEDIGIALLEVSLGDSTYTFSAAPVGDADILKLGQSVIAFGGKERQAISVGVVSALTPISRSQEGTTTPTTFVGFIDASASPAEGARGGALSNIFGEIIGMSVGDRSTRFVSENLIREKLISLSEPVSKGAR